MLAGAGRTSTAAAAWAEISINVPGRVIRSGSIGERLAAAECVSQGKSVNIAQLATNRNAMGQSGNQDLLAIKTVGYVVGGSLAFHGRVGSQNQFCHALVANSSEQTFNANFFRPHAING